MWGYNSIPIQYDFPGTLRRIIDIPVVLCHRRNSAVASDDAGIPKEFTLRYEARFGML